MDDKQGNMRQFGSSTYTFFKVLHRIVKYSVKTGNMNLIENKLTIHVYV